MPLSPRSLAATVLLLGLALLAPSAHAFIASPGDSCTDCVAVADLCCAIAPNYQGPGAPTFSPNILVGTRYPSSVPYVVTIYDLGSPLPAGPEDADWAAMTRYYGPGAGWTIDSLGTVFGLTLDEYGNIFVTHTAIYSSDQIGQVFGGAAGAIYRIDAVTGAINVFATLPNFPDGSYSPPENMPGLGNITYDCKFKQFFVTNVEDGKIYRIKPVGVNGLTGTVVQTFDPLAPDTGVPGFAPLGERLWAVQIHGDRVFYSVWVEDFITTSPLDNQIRSVQLNLAGAMVPGTDKLELNVPADPNTTWAPNMFSSPVSDISFNVNGRMLLAERSMGDPTTTSAHLSRVLEYECVNYCWQRTNPFDVGDCCGRINAAGGVDYDNMPYAGPSGAIGRVWASGDALHLSGSYTDIIYGLQGFRPTGGNIVNSMLIDSDGFAGFQDKSYQGDVEKPGCPPSVLGSICGVKFMDANHNGVIDGAETGIPGWTIVLTGPGGPYTTTTNANGAYCFTNLGPGTYLVSENAVASYVQTAPASGTYSVTLAVGQTIGGKDFGNYLCQSGPCAPAPTGMTAWWPFNEATTATTAADLTHLSPARNVAQLFGGAAISINGEVGNRLCFPNELAYAAIPSSNQLGLDIMAQPFSIDAWIRVPNSTGTPRMLVDKRTLVSSVPYKTRGYAVYLNGMQLFLELGNGATTQIIPGPIVTAATWNHFAVTVSRSPQAGLWYLNGAVQPTYNFLPTPGNATTTAPMYFGHTNPAFPLGSPLTGCIDELEIFTNTVLPASTISAVYQAGVAGKCPDIVRLPAVTSICKNDSTVLVCFNICNTSASTQSYHWSLAPLPAGPGCTVAGPITFSPSLGTITVPPGGCTTPICITIPRPPGLTAQNATSCFALSVVNDSTGRCQTRNGTIRADNTCYCIKAVTPGVVAVPARLAGGIIGIPIDIGVGFPCPPIDRLSYAVTARFDGGNQEDPLKLSLNGLPPGEPVIGFLDASPEPEVTLSFAVSYPDGHDLGAPYSLVFSADTDGDGIMEEMCSVPVASSSDSVAVTDAPRPGERLEVARLQAAPNPFFGGSVIAFAIPVAGQVELGVYDVNGRLVRMLRQGMTTAGTHSIEWDGRDPSGRRAPAGVYFVRLDTAQNQLRAKLIKLR